MDVAAEVTRRSSTLTSDRWSLTAGVSNPPRYLGSYNKSPPGRVRNGGVVGRFNVREWLTHGVAQGVLVRAPWAFFPVTVSSRRLLRDYDAAVIRAAVASVAA